jgi:phosphohistidine phosphatase
MTGSAPDRRSAVVLLVHHGDAVAPDVDPQRPLSSLGRRQAEWLATYAHDAGIRPTAIWHSGKLRARQTAEPFLLICNPGAEFRAVRGLRPEDRAEAVREVLVGEAEDIAIVSHMPVLPAIAEALIGERVEFPLNGMMLLERLGPMSYRMRWRVSPANDETR